MVSNFYSDLAAARKTEALVKEVIEKELPQYEIKDVADKREFFHKGDLYATNKETGKSRFIEVKDDSRIAETHNILLEESTLFYENNERVKGNLYSDYEIYAVVSKQEKKIYFFEFEKLRKLSFCGRELTVKHEEQENDVLLLPLEIASKRGALITILNY